MRLPLLPPLLLLLLHILQKFPTQFALPRRLLFLSSSLLVCIFCLLLLFLQCLSYLIFGRCLPRILLHWRRRRLRFASISFFMCCFFLFEVFSFSFLILCFSHSRIHCWLLWKQVSCLAVCDFCVISRLVNTFGLTDSLFSASASSSSSSSSTMSALSCNDHQ